jgi:hypothetical protein
VVSAQARSLKELQMIEPKAQQVYRRYLDGLGGANIKKLAIHRRVSRRDYSRRCAEDQLCRFILSRVYQ